MSFKAIFLTGTLVTAGLVADAGFVQVKVHEKRENGTNLNLYVPAILAPLGMHAIPAKHFAHLSREQREALPLLVIATRELEKISDGPLVEVKSDREQVRVAKENGSIVVDVNDSGETVHISVPIRMLHRMATDLEQKAAAAPSPSDSNDDPPPGADSNHSSTSHSHSRS